MARKALPSQEVLRQLLDYSPATGRLFWRERPAEFFYGEGHKTKDHLAAMWNARCAGEECFLGVSATGYRRGSIFAIKHFAHRVIWEMQIGGCPDVIDHINGDKLDNRLRNLRSASISENAYNSRLSRSNQSGFKGVSWKEEKKKWRAVIKVGVRQIHLGYFSDPIVAHKAYCKAAAEYAGAFARTG